jgi:hypothetical protein
MAAAMAESGLSAGDAADRRSQRPAGLEPAHSFEIALEVNGETHHVAVDARMRELPILPERPLAGSA